MPFVDVCRAVYDYSPNAEEELEIKGGDVLLVLEKSSDDDWWKAKRKAANEDDEEPEGLVPANYLEKVQPLKQARALYDYSEQQDEEISFSDGARLDVFDESDPDWTLVGLGGKYGFAPAIYLEAATGAPPAASAAPAPALPSRELAPPPMPARPQTYDDPIPGEADYPDPGQGPTPELEPQANNPAAALAGIIAQKTGGAQSSPTRDRGLASPPLPSRPQYTPEQSDDEAPPPMPTRPKSQIASPSLPPLASPRSPEPPGVMSSPPYNRVTSGQWGDNPDSDAARSPGGFHLYNIHEVVKHMGKNKKMPTTLGINNAKGLIMISPEKSRDGPSNEWTADKLTHYSIEGKHVFIDLVRPSKSIDFHAGAKDTAHEIVAHLGELAGAVRAEGLKEVWAAGAGTGAAGKKKGQMLYEFMAQGDDEVTVAVDDEVIVLDDTASDEWWKVKRVRNGKEGVVPSSYVEITGTIQGAPDTITGLNAARSTVEQNRLEDERLAKEAARSKKDDSIPERHSSLAGETSRTSSRRTDKRASKDQSKSKPNQARVRTWTDRSGTFKVEAEFIGLRDGKIHLHKQNGVKIAVPVNKMAVEDLEYVERATGTSLDDDKPLVDLKRKGTSKPKETNGTRAGASVQKTQDEYDWFDFFLQCGVNPQICERYAAAFSRDQMSPEILPEVDDKLLRTLGLKEGDILRVTKFLDNKYDRKRAPAADAESSDGANGGLFSGPGGALRNNTRKGRPAPPVSTNDVVSEDAFKPRSPAPADIKETPLASASARQPNSGFDDDAWDVKPARTQTATTPVPAPAPAEPPKTVEPLKPKVNDDLSLLAMPLQPEKTGPATAAAQPTQPTAAASAPAPSQQPQQQQGADQALFEKIAALAPPRQRPQPPAQHPMATGLAPPPRAASAPGFNPQQQGSQFAPPPLQPQLTGVPPQQQMYPQQTGYPQQQMNGLQPQQGFQGFQPTGVQAMQQNYPALQPQPTGMAFQPQSAFGQQQAMQQYPQQNGFPPQQTGFPGQPNYQQALVNGAQIGSPFADPPRQPFQPTPLGLSNSFGPQQTGYQQPQPSFNISQPTGMNGMNGYQAPPVPQLPPQQTGGVFGPSQPITPLVPQKTGPPPPVRFGVTGAADRLMPQPTGRANLAKATPQNPFGF